MFIYCSQKLEIKKLIRLYVIFLLQFSWTFLPHKIYKKPVDSDNNHLFGNKNSVKAPYSYVLVCVCACMCEKQISGIMSGIKAQSPNIKNRLKHKTLDKKGCPCRFLCSY